MGSKQVPKFATMEIPLMETDAKAIEHSLKLNTSELEVALRPKTSERNALLVFIRTL